MKAKAKGPLQFGIRTLDELLQKGGGGLDPRTWPDNPWTLAVVGPDGVGKSLLSLHLASLYAATTENVRVLYVSTDLSWYQADTSFKDFGLRRPSARLTRLAEVYALDKPNGITLEDVELEHLPLHRLPDAKKDPSSLWRDLLGQRPKSHSVGFVDLQATTAGDDWGFVSKLLGLLGHLRGNSGSACNLMVIDAVEGMEMFVGERDQFGEPRSRRSRVAQLVRMARATRTHLALVVEEPQEGLHLPEQFVADAVIRLRQRSERGFSMRTIEVEKCRGCKHVRGEHMLVIRSGTSAQPNAKIKENWLDEPAVRLPAKSGKPLPHLVVIPSLHYWHGQQARNGRARLHGIGTCPGFGGHLGELNALLPKPTADGGSGRPTGSLTLLLGESGTSKSHLAQYFLANAFRRNTRERQCAAILLTTTHMGQEQLEATLRRIAVREQEVRARPRVRCRCLDPRFMTSGEFVRMLHRYVEDARKLVAGDVYLVIDDWSLFLSSHPGIASDPRFAPAVLDYLKQQHVHAMVVATQPVKPDTAVAEELGRDLRRLNELQILTWSVPFFGQQRTAITVVVPSSGGTTPTVYGLRSSPCQSGQPCKLSRKNAHCNDPRNRGDILTIDCGFALYDGLERGLAKRVPLEIRLFGGYLAPDTKHESPGEFHRYLDHKTRDLFFGLSRDSGVVRYEAMESYGHLFHFASSLDTTRLEQTLVLQVDEFWFPEEQTGSRLMNLKSYWTGDLRSSAHERTREEFPESLLKKRQRERQSFTRSSFFSNQDPDDRPVYRIPYLRDFGFLLANRTDWAACKNIQLSSGPDPSRSVTVGDVWDRLCRIGGFNLGTASRRASGPISWPEFFEAAEIVGQATQHLPFDVDPTVSQTLLCLTMEVWLSLLYDSSGGKSLLEPMTQGQPGTPPTSLREMFAYGTKGDNNLAKRMWFAAMLQIACACRHLRSRDRAISRCPDVPVAAVASREWYSTASLQMRANTHDLIPLRLPGHFSVCGDWHLAVAAGSRSEPLAHAVLDLLSSREMSLLRVQDGMGLPVRRHTGSDRAEGQIRTSLRICAGRTGDGPMRMLYKRELDGLGPDDDTSTQAKEQFFLLRRSLLKGYGRDFFHLQRHIALFLEEQERWIPALCRKSGNWRQIRRFCAAPNSRESKPLKKAFNAYVRNIDWMLDVLSS